jgi:hypothetical protein
MISLEESINDKLDAYYLKKQYTWTLYFNITSS